MIVSASLVAMVHNAHLVRSHPPLIEAAPLTRLLPHLGVLFAHTYDQSGAHMCTHALNCAHTCTCVYTGAHMWVWLGVGVGAGECGSVWVDVGVGCGCGCWCGWVWVCGWLCV